MYFFSISLFSFVSSTVDEGAIIDVQFNEFYHVPPSGFDKIMFEQSLLWHLYYEEWTLPAATVTSINSMDIAACHETSLHNIVDWASSFSDINSMEITVVYRETTLSRTICHAFVVILFRNRSFCSNHELSLGDASLKLGIVTLVCDTRLLWITDYAVSIATTPRITNKCKRILWVTVK